MTDVGTSVLSDTPSMVPISAPHLLPTTPSTSSTSSLLRMDVKSGNTETVLMTTSYAYTEELKKREEKSKNHLSSLIVEPGSTVSTT